MYAGESVEIVLQQLKNHVLRGPMFDGQHDGQIATFQSRAHEVRTTVLCPSAEGADPSLHNGVPYWMVAKGAAASQAAHGFDHSP